jgi:RNA polymerase sigma factor (sigma-70 family)
MALNDLQDRLSRISTSWNILKQAHQGLESEAMVAKQLLLERYGKAVRRYLAKLVRNPEATEDLMSEFTLILLRGDFRHADPIKGKFRNYVKSTLRHLVSKYRRQIAAQPKLLAPDSPEWELLAIVSKEEEQSFDSGWRKELLHRAWSTLAETRPPLYVTLRIRSKKGKLSAKQLAELVSPQLGKTITPTNARQMLRRARDTFAEFLLDIVAHSLDEPSIESLEEELSELGLLKYCRRILVKYREKET